MIFKPGTPTQFPGRVHTYGYGSPALSPALLTSTVGRRYCTITHSTPNYVTRHAGSHELLADGHCAHQVATSMAKAHAPAIKIMSSHTHHSCTCTQIADLSDTAAHSRMCGQYAAEATLNANKQTVCAASAWAFLVAFWRHTVLYAACVSANAEAQK